MELCTLLISASEEGIIHANRGIDAGSMKHCCEEKKRLRNNEKHSFRVDGVVH
jgi:hypothetical protein